MGMGVEIPSPRQRGDAAMKWCRTMAMFFMRFAVCVIIIIIIDKTDAGLNGLCIRAFQFGQKIFDSIRFSLPNRFFSIRFDSAI